MPQWTDTRVQQALEKHRKQVPTWQRALAQNIPPACVETLNDRLAMMALTYDALAPQDRHKLTQLLSSDTLTQTVGDDGPAHSLLYYLYGFLATPTAAGLNPRLTLAETVRVLANPNAVMQDYAPVSKDNAVRLWQLRSRPPKDAHHNQPFNPTMRPFTVFRTQTNNCGVTAELSRMASENPKDFARLVLQATRPALMMWERATGAELNPEDPSQAAQTLRARNLVGHWDARGNAFWVELPVPAEALIRAINAQQHPMPGTGSGIEALMQGALLYNASKKTYDAATDTRSPVVETLAALKNATSIPDQDLDPLADQLMNNPSNQAAYQNITQYLATHPNVSNQDKRALVNSFFAEWRGLTEQEETDLQSLMEDNGPISMVYYQIQDRSPDSDDGGAMLHFGYTRPFEKTTLDVLNSLWNHQETIGGITFPVEGINRGGHIVKIAGYQVDPATKQLDFLVTDSDDGQKPLVPQNTRDFVPLLHHLGLRQPQAAAVQGDIRHHGHAILTPNAADAQWFRFPQSTTKAYPHLLYPGETMQDVMQYMQTVQAVLQQTA